MSEFSAFLSGLILADNSPVPTKSNHAPLKSNIALQDVAFCQSLRNIIDGLENYVSSEHPTPQEFIRHILPSEDFEEPLTQDEKKTIASHQRYEKEYVAWITSELTSSGERWEDLTATRMIWRDPAHTPDIDNLDLLFGDPLLSSPLKTRGRVYEYNTTIPLSGLATNFFETMPAKIIMALCCQCSCEIVKKLGYQYDYKRFEYNYVADKHDRIELWKVSQREAAYRILIREMPTFCKNPWSNLTRDLLEEAKKKSTHEKEHGNAHSLSREDERVTILNNVYSQNERIEAYRVGVKHIQSTKSAKAYKVSIYLFIATIVITIIAFVCFALIDIIESTMFFVLFGSLVIAIVLWNAGNHIWKILLSTRAEQYTIKVLQDAYYNQTDVEKANEYKKLLERLEKINLNSQNKM